jgi:hypothetical protein
MESRASATDRPSIDGANAGAQQNHLNLSLFLGQNAPGLAGRQRRSVPTINFLSVSQRKTTVMKKFSILLTALLALALGATACQKKEEKKPAAAPAAEAPAAAPTGEAAKPAEGAAPAQAPAAPAAPEKK